MNITSLTTKLLFYIIIWSLFKYFMYTVIFRNIIREYIKVWLSPLSLLYFPSFAIHWTWKYFLTFSIMALQEIQQPIYLLIVVYQHGDNKVSGVACRQFLSHQPCRPGQGISVKCNFFICFAIQLWHRM